MGKWIKFDHITWRLEDRNGGAIMTRVADRWKISFFAENQRLGSLEDAQSFVENVLQRILSNTKFDKSEMTSYDKVAGGPATQLDFAVAAYKKAQAELDEFEKLLARRDELRKAVKDAAKRIQDIISGKAPSEPAKGERQKFDLDELRECPDCHEQKPLRDWYTYYYKGERVTKRCKICHERKRAEAMQEPAEL